MAPPPSSLHPARPAPALEVRGGDPSPSVLAREALAIPRTAWRYRELAVTSVRRDLAARFRGALLGRVWPLLQPLALFLVYAFVFGELLGLRLAAPGSGTGLGAWMFVGALVWSSFSDALQRATTSVTDHGHLVRKLAFPACVLPLNAVLASTALFLAGVAVYLGVAWAVPAVPDPGAGLAWLPAALLVQGVLTWGAGLFFAAVHVEVRDTAHALGVATTVLMLATPVFWVPVPEVLPGVAPWLALVDANPLHHLLVVWRAALLSGEPEVLFPHDVPRSLAIASAFALGVWMLGATVFSAGQRRFADEV